MTIKTKNLLIEITTLPSIAVVRYSDKAEFFLQDEGAEIILRENPTDADLIRFFEGA